MTMKKILKIIGTIGAITILLLCAYLLGTTQAETVTQVKTIEKIRIVVPDNYINMESVIDFDVTDYGLQLYFNDGTGYYLEK